VRESSRHRLNVEYDILLSPTYEVPVLYFAIRNAGNHTGPEGLDAIYEHLVPSQFKSSLGEVGVLGGISVGVCIPFSSTSPRTIFNSG
jgi:ubiquitin-like-conjugating enzyme ATG10